MVLEMQIPSPGESIPLKRAHETRKLVGQEVFLFLRVTSENHLKAEPGFNLIRNSLKYSEL